MKRASNSDTHVCTRGTHMCSPGTQTRAMKARMCVHVGHTYAYHWNTSMYPGTPRVRLKHTCVYTRNTHMRTRELNINPHPKRAHTCTSKTIMRFLEHILHMCVPRVHMCVFTCAHACLARVHICVFTCTHMCVSIGHVCVAQVKTCWVSDEHCCVCVPGAHICVFTCAQMCTHMCVHVTCTHMCVCVFQLDTCLRSRTTRGCYPVRTLVCAPGAHLCECSRVHICVFHVRTCVFQMNTCLCSR